MLDLDQAGRGDHGAPRLQVEVGPVPPPVPALVILSVGIRAEEDTARPERGAELPEDARQLLGRDVEQRGVGEDAVEVRHREIEREKVLVQHLAAGVLSRHGDEAGGTVEANGLVAQVAEHAEVTTGAAAEVQDPERGGLEVGEEGVDVLADVVVAGALAECVRRGVIVGERGLRDRPEVVPIEPR